LTRSNSTIIIIIFFIGWNKDGQFFVYIGAHQDMPNEKSYFGRVEVKSWGTGLRDLAYLGKAEEE
jgi:hypothetical protein